MSILVAPLRPLSMAKIKLPLSFHHSLREFRIHFNVYVDLDFDVDFDFILVLRIRRLSSADTLYFY